jgi:hypothetical protein
MTARSIEEVDTELLEFISFAYGIHIERSSDDQRMYLVRDGITYWAASPVAAVAS